MANLFQSVRGFNDVLPTDTAIWQYLHNTAADVFAAYGYGEIKLPLLEHTELFKRSIGEATDVVEKEIARLTKERDALENEKTRVEGQLANEAFVAKAPAAVVDKLRTRRGEIDVALTTLRQTLEKWS